MKTWTIDRKNRLEWQDGWGVLEFGELHWPIYENREAARVRAKEIRKRTVLRPKLTIVKVRVIAAWRKA